MHICIMSEENLVSFFITNVKKKIYGHLYESRFTLLYLSLVKNLVWVLLFLDFFYF